MGRGGSEHIFLLTVGICLSAITISTIVLAKIIRNHLAARRRRLKKRNSLQKYPSFVANKITGTLTIVPPNGLRRDSNSQQYIIAVSPPIDFYNSKLSLYERLYAYPGRAKRDSESSTDSCTNFSISSYSESESDENYDSITTTTTTAPNPFHFQPTDQYIVSGMTDENNNEIIQTENRNSNKE